MSRTGFVYRREGLEHIGPAGHPECPDRLRSLMNTLEGARLDLPTIDVEQATREDILRVHDGDHIDMMKRCSTESIRYPDPDMYFSSGSWDAALWAAGSVIGACKAVLDGEVDNAFCAVRPPGHHAERDRAMGFCIFNNVAVAARWLRAVGGVKRVAILDWDVHHGNGTQHTFYDDESVYYVSLHQHPHYPGTGNPNERGAKDTNLNIQMAPDTPAEAWLEAIEKTALPELDRFEPDFFLISSGFDAHRLDPLSQQNLETETYAAMTKTVKGLANGKIVSVLEGGYHLRALGEAAVAHVKALRE